VATFRFKAALHFVSGALADIGSQQNEDVEGHGGWVQVDTGGEVSSALRIAVRIGRFVNIRTLTTCEDALSKYIPM
jgi:hypothetical protein